VNQWLQSRSLRFRFVTPSSSHPFPLSVYVHLAIAASWLTAGATFLRAPVTKVVLGAALRSPDALVCIY